jgi:HEAT repeat protein
VRLRITRRRLLVLAAITIGAGLIGTELYYLSPSVRLVFVNAAEELGADEFLVGRLSDRDLKVRSEAGDALVHHGAKAVPALVAKLNDPDPGHRRSAATTLAKMGPEAIESYPVLWRLATEDKDEGVLETTGQALGMVAKGDSKKVLELLATMESTTDAARLAATRAAARLEDARAVPLLIASLKYNNPKVREEAAESLGEMKALSVTALPALLECLNDPVTEVRGEAIQSIAKVIKASPNSIDPELLAKAKMVVESAPVVRNAPKPDDDDQ